MLIMSWMGKINLLVANAATDMLVASIALVVVLLLAAQVLRLADRWRRQSDKPILSAQEEMAEYRRWAEEGLVSAEEFERFKRKLEPRLRAEMDALANKGQPTPEELAKQLVPVPAPRQDPPPGEPETPGPQAS
jgi:uncharacterized membrane protein